LPFSSPIAQKLKPLTAIPIAVACAYFFQPRRGGNTAFAAPMAAPLAAPTPASTPAPVNAFAPSAIW